VEAVKKWYGWR